MTYSSPVYTCKLQETRPPHVQTYKKDIVSLTGEHRKIARKVTRDIWSTGIQKLVELDGDYQLILSLNTSVGFGLVRLHDCDVLAVKVVSPFSAPPDDFPHVFAGLGALPGKYHIVIDENIPPCEHARD